MGSYDNAWVIDALGEAADELAELMDQYEQQIRQLEILREHLQDRSDADPVLCTVADKGIAETLGYLHRGENGMRLASKRIVRLQDQAEGDWQ